MSTARLVTDDKLHDPKMEKLGLAKLRETAYNLAWARAKSELDNLAKVENQLPLIMNRLDRIEARDLQVNVRTSLLPATVKTDPKKPDPLTCLVAATTAEFLRRVKQRPTSETIKELHPGDDAKLIRRMATQMLIRSARTTASSVDVGWGGILAKSKVLDWIESLARPSIFGQLAKASGRVLPFSDYNSLTMPRRNTTTHDLKPAFVGEGATIPVKASVLSSITFTRYKLGVISTFTTELARVSTPFIADVIRDMILDDLAIALDDRLLNVAAVAEAGVAPGGLWLNAANQASGGVTLTDVINDIAWLISQVGSQQPRKPVLIMDPARSQRLSMMREDGVFLFRDEISRGQIFGTPILTSMNVPEDKVYAIDADDFVSWMLPPELDLSQSATLVLQNDDGVSPTMLPPGAINVPGSTKISDAASQTPPGTVSNMLQQSAEALRMIAPMSYGLMRDETRAYLTAVNW